jgi:hypothetical protein
MSRAAAVEAATRVWIASARDSSGATFDTRRPELCKLDSLRAVEETVIIRFILKIQIGQTTALFDCVPITKFTSLIPSY